MAFTDDFAGGSLGPEWADDGPLLVDYLRDGYTVSGGAWQTDGLTNTNPFAYMGSIRRTDNNCADQFIEAEVGNLFQGHDPGVAEYFQYVEATFWLFAHISPGSNAAIGAHFIIQTNSNPPSAQDGSCFVEFLTVDEDGEMNFFGAGGDTRPLPGWRANPAWTIRLEVTAAGHCKAFFEGVLLDEDDTTPLGGSHVGIAMEWNKTNYNSSFPTNPGVSPRVESVTGSLCAGGWRVGRIGAGADNW